MTNMRRYSWIALLSLALVALGCNKMGSRSDSQIASDVQNKIFGDSTVPDKQITINANKGVVTLSGTVSSDAARTAAANDASQVDGVKTVVNNLEVAPTSAALNPVQPTTPVAEPAPAPAPTRATTTRARRSNPGYGSSGNNGLRTTVPSSSSGSYTPADPAPPPTKATVPAGTQLSIRMTDEVDSEKAQVG